jgi:hypothetical protein
MTMGSPLSITQIYTSLGERLDMSRHLILTDLRYHSFVEDPNQVVMRDDLQDPVIKHTYANLPWVGLVLSIIPGAIAC